jgi:signal transduction histidine kinase
LDAPALRGEILPPCAAPSGFATASVVHDLGNLIQIASSALYLVTRTPDMPAGEAGTMLDRAKTCLDQAGALVRQSLGRLRNPTDRAESSDIAACLADVRTIVAAMNQPGLTLEIDLEPGLSEVRCNPIGLRRAILNLVLNAQDAMTGKGTVLIRTRAVRHGGSPMMRIEVADRGAGMSPEVLARAFDPHFTTKKGGVGGIGLPTVERFAHASGGDVSLASKPGAGTVVTLCLPAATPAHCPTKEP